MARCIEFFERDFVNAFDFVVNNRFSCHKPSPILLASGPPASYSWYTVAARRPP
jgi:hypothetical protein